MDKYIKIIEKYKANDNKTSVLTIIQEILNSTGENGASLSEIYNVVETIGYKFDKSVIRAYMNRNIVGSTIKGGHNLWYRKGKGIYISKNFFIK